MPLFFLVKLNFKFISERDDLLTEKINGLSKIASTLFMTNHLLAVDLLVGAPPPSRVQTPG